MRISLIPSTLAHIEKVGENINSISADGIVKLVYMVVEKRVRAVSGRDGI